MSDLQRVIYNKTLRMSKITRVANRISLLLPKVTPNNIWTSMLSGIALMAPSKPKLAVYHQTRLPPRVQRISLDPVRDLQIKLPVHNTIKSVEMILLSHHLSRNS